MKRLISLVILVIISIHLFGQRGTIKIKKTDSDSINIIGQWIRVYDKNRRGEIIKVEKNNIDTLNYLQGNKFFKQQAGRLEPAIWTLNQKERKICYTSLNIPATNVTTPSPPIVQTTIGPACNYIGIANRDTLTILRYYKDIVDQVSYYIRKK